jgi:hypothetical protein
MRRLLTTRKFQGIFPGLMMVTAIALATGTAACATKAPTQVRPIAEEGLNVVRIEAAPDAGRNTHPISLTPTEVATLLRGVRVWEDRNIVHRLVSGAAQRTRAFRDNEIEFLAPAISRALAQAGPSDRIYFHLSHATESGEEETTSGWLYLRDPLLYLLLSEAHDRHGPGPDISKYDRRMPDIPEQSGSFKVAFEPEQYVEGVSSRGGWFSADQREELRIYYRQALPVLPTHPLERDQVNSQR